MKRIILLLFSLTVCTISKADSTQNILLKFKQIQQSSQTYKDYKVIKIQTLLGWTNEADVFITNQSKEIEKLIEENKNLNQRVSKLNQNLNQLKSEIKSQNFAQTHISLAGMEIHKNTWLIFFFSLLATIVAGIIFYVGKNKVLQIQLSNKKQELLGLTSEYESLKQRSLEKQMKLSRELQNERNKLEQLKSEIRQSL